MVEPTTFFGIPLRTRGHRHALVIGYYAVLATFCVVAMWHNDLKLLRFFWPQAITLGALLGGVRVGGPVKYYGETKTMDQMGSITTLNLNGRTGPKFWPLADPLDEREKERRNAAHYLAYRILIASVGIAAIASAVGIETLNWTMTGRLPAAMWCLLVYMISLPSAVLLWTEPEEPRADVVEMPARV